MNLDQQIAKSLSYFGLDEIDAQMYLSLLKIGEITVGNLSVKLEIDRGKAYRSLNKLRNLGMITTTFSNPTTCIATKPDRALPLILQKKEHEITFMKKFADEIIAQQHQLTHVEPSVESTSFSIIQGRVNIYTRIGKLIEEATDTVYLITTIDDIAMMYHTSIPEKISAAIKNGTEIRLVIDTDNDDLVPLITRLGITNAHIGKLPSKSRMVVEKGKQLIMSGTMRESKDLNDEIDSILQTNSPNMINNIYVLCNQLWKKAKPVQVLSASTYAKQ